MGHADGSVEDRYSHIIAAMRQRLMDEQWEEALRTRKAIAPDSPVEALHKLIRAL